MSNQVKISNLRNYLTGLVANQAKLTQPAYANKYSLVNAVTTTSNAMNINPKTGTITIVGPTGTYTVSQPQINPLPVNSTKAFIQTNNNQVSVTSEGATDTIIKSTILTVSSFTQENTGSNTLNNTVQNINNNILGDFWNPQRNLNQVIDGYTGYPYILKYTFTGASSTGADIFKFYIKNNISSENYNFPGFKTIKVYPPSNPSNNVIITPSFDINNFYSNDTQVLLLKDDGTPYFTNTKDLTVEINMNTYVGPSYEQYSFGPNSGVIYNKLVNENKYQTAVVNGGYIYASSDYGVTWTEKTTSSQNWSAVAMSFSGQYQTAVVNGEYIYTSSNYGSTWTANTTYSKNWSAIAMSETGQYQTATATGEYIYISSDYGNTWSQITFQGVGNWTGIAMTSNGEIQYITNNGYIYKSIDYGATWNNIVTSPVKNWKSISTSLDGSIVNAVVSNEYRYRSLNYGVTWTQHVDTFVLQNDGNHVLTSDPQNWSSISSNEGGGFSIISVNGSQLFNSYNINKFAFGRIVSTSNWTSVSCSNSGKYASACANNSVIYTSSNYGVDWTATQSLALNWSSIAISKGYNDPNSTVGLRAGDFVSYNSATGTIDQWTTPVFANNYSTSTGTTLIGNRNFMSSSDGRVQVVAAKDNYGWYSHNYGTSWLRQGDQLGQGGGEGTDDMTISEDGQYALYFKRGVYNNYNSILQISNGFSNNRSPTYSLNYPAPFLNKLIDEYNVAMSPNGKYQFFIGQYTGTGTNYFGVNYLFYQKNYSDASDTAAWPNSTISFPYGYSGTLNYVDSFVDVSGNITIVYNDNVRPILVTGTASSNYTSWTQIDLYTTTQVYSVNKNYNKDSSIDSKFITLIAWDSASGGIPAFYTINNGILNFNFFGGWYNPYTDIGNTAVKVSSTGQYQVATFTFASSGPNIPAVVYYSSDYGDNWTKVSSDIQLNVLKAKQPIVSNDDFSYITICGGHTLGNPSAGDYDFIKPCTYFSTDKGVTWNFNSSIVPSTELQVLAFYYPSIQTNKTYFQIKDLNQNQVLGVSDNGFRMSKDLRVTNANGYIIGGTMTIGPDEASSLLNNYSLNVDGTVSCRNVVTLSDKRFKDVLGNISDKDSYENISKLNIINYKYIDRPDDDRVYTGMVAQDVYDIFNDAVDINSSTYISADGTIEIPDIYSIKYNVINAYLISAFKQSQKYIKNLEEENNNFRNEIQSLKNEFLTLKNDFNNLKK